MIPEPDSLPRPTPAADIPTSTSDRCTRFSVARDVSVPMRDGVHLSANVFHPALPGPLPVILIRLPYGKDDHPGMAAQGGYWARKGYMCVIQDVRGKFGSEGVWTPFVNEAQDGYDTLDWIAAQPWCDGAVGMTGASYMGMTQWAIASLGHPSLRCIAPGDSTPDPYSLYYQGGAFSLLFALWSCAMAGRGVGDPARFDPWHLPLATLDRSMGVASPHLRDVLAHPVRDAFWASAEWSRPAPGGRVPALHWGGWYDVMLGGTLFGWRAAASGDGAAGHDQWLVVGPTDHTLTPAAYGGGPAAASSAGAWSFDRVQRFFDFWLRGEDDGLSESPRVDVFVMGEERWRQFASWPPPGARGLRLYLSSSGDAGGPGGGRLTAASPSDDPPDCYDYDPRRPIDTWLGEDLWQLGWTQRDRRRVEERNDVLVYSSEPLSGDLEVVGPVRVTLSVGSTAPGTDFTATLVDVSSGGATCLVQEGIVRAGRSESCPGARPLGTGCVAELSIDLCATAYRFSAGHCVRVEIASSIFGRFDRNLNSGRPFAQDERPQVARQTVYHSAEHASYITLPVVHPLARGALRPDADPPPAPTRPAPADGQHHQPEEAT